MLLAFVRLWQAPKVKYLPKIIISHCSGCLLVGKFHTLEGRNYYFSLRCHSQLRPRAAHVMDSIRLSRRCLIVSCEQDQEFQICSLQLSDIRTSRYLLEMPKCRICSSTALFKTQHSLGDRDFIGSLIHRIYRRIFFPFGYVPAKELRFLQPEGSRFASG